MVALEAKITDKGHPEDTDDEKHNFFKRTYLLYKNNSLFYKFRFIKI